MKTKIIEPYLTGEIQFNMVVRLSDGLVVITYNILVYVYTTTSFETHIWLLLIDHKRLTGLRVYISFWNRIELDERKLVPTKWTWIQFFVVLLLLLTWNVSSRKKKKKLMRFLYLLYCRFGFRTEERSGEKEITRKKDPVDLHIMPIHNHVLVNLFLWLSSN